MTAACENCKFFSAVESVCRKRLLSGFVVTPQGVAVNAGFPNVKKHWWCGEYEARLELMS